MTPFPGRIFNADGIAVDRRRPDLTQAQIDICDGRAMVAKSGASPVPAAERIWLLDDDASPASIPQPYWDEAVTLMRDGKGIVLLAQEASVVDSIRARLIDLLDLAGAPHAAAGCA